MPTAKPPARYGAIGGARPGGFTLPSYTHHWEHDRAWGEDIIVSADKGRVEKTLVRHQGPPARLAADWFGDHLLTYTGEIVDFFDGKVVGNVNSK